MVLDTGEPHSLLSRSLLEGAVAAPQQTFDYDQRADLVSLACTLTISVARAHAFLQGNKRTGFVAGMIFLAINGISIRQAKAFDEKAADLIIAALADKNRFDDFRDWVRKFAQPTGQRIAKPAKPSK